MCSSDLAEMSRAGVPVPPGYTIATDVCNIYFDNHSTVQIGRASCRERVSMFV